MCVFVLTDIKFFLIFRAEIIKFETSLVCCTKCSIEHGILA